MSSHKLAQFSFFQCLYLALFLGVPPKLLVVKRGESERDYRLGGSKQEVGTPIFNPLLNRLQVESQLCGDWRDPHNRRLHQRGVDTAVRTKEMHWPHFSEPVYRTWIQVIPGSRPINRATAAHTQALITMSLQTTLAEGGWNGDHLWGVLLQHGRTLS